MKKKLVRSHKAKPTSDTLERILLIPDTHSPYHDKRAFKLVMKVAEYYKPQWVVILGDFGDFYKISFHPKDPTRLASFKDELRITAKLLREVESHCHGERIYIHGNHEYRLHRYLQDRAPELYSLVVDQDFLELQSHGWKQVPYKQDTSIGPLYLTHDVGQSGLYSTRQAMVSYQDNVVIGHNHRLDYHVGGNAKGVPHVGASFGWLGDVSKVDYMHQMKAKSQWALGFGWGQYNPNTNLVYLQPVPIVKYTCSVEGRIFS